MESYQAMEQRNEQMVTSGDWGAGLDVKKEHRERESPQISVKKEEEGEQQIVVKSEEEEFIVVEQELQQTVVKLEDEEGRLIVEEVLKERGQHIVVKKEEDDEQQIAVMEEEEQSIVVKDVGQLIAVYEKEGQQILVQEEERDHHKWIHIVVKEEETQPIVVEKAKVERQPNQPVTVECATHVFSKMADRSTTRRINWKRTLELVMQEGSDLDISDDDSGDGVLDSGDEFVPMHDDFGDYSDNESVDHDIVYDAPADIDSDNDVEKPDAGAFPVMFDDGSDTEWMEDWTQSLKNFPVSAPFEGGSGLNIPEDFQALPSPLDFYELIVTPSVIELFKTETNRYARTTCDEKKAAGGLSASSVFNTWTPVTLDEMKKFLAILVHMGLVKKPKINDYWSTHPALSTTFASRLMTRSRFNVILAFFHLNDNARFIPCGQPDHDPLFKLRPLFDHLVQKFQQLYKPEEEICIDEAMCPWRGRSAFSCYMKDKPTKWGIKLYELCESVSGYVCNMEVMCHEPGVSNKPKEVCLRLLTPFANKGHTLFVDKDYCNPELADELVAENTAVVGPVRANHIGLPRDLAQQQMKQGEMDYRRRNQLLYIHWKDKRDVHMLTTKHLPQMKRVSSRARPQNQKDKPVCVVEYIHNMAGVNKSDQMISYLPLHRKTVKWWKKLAFHLMTLVMIQGHILYNKHKKEHQEKEMCLEDFVKSVCVSLAAQPTIDRAEDEAAAVPLPKRLCLGAAVPPPNVMDRLRSGSHFPEELPSKPGSNAKLQRTCKVCYDRMKHRGASRDELKNRVSHTKYRCEQCHVNLCITPCFKVWHTKDKYHI